MEKEIEILFGDIKANVLYSEEILQREESMLVPFHFHQYVEFHVIVSGSCTIRTQKNVFVLQAGNICVIPRLVAHNVENCSDDLKKAVITVAFENVSKKICEDFLFFDAAFRKSDACVVDNIKLCEWFLENTKKRNPMREVKLQAVFSLLLINLAEQILSTVENVSYDDLGMRFDERILFIEEYIHTKYDEDISLEKLSHIMHISERHINRILKKHSGIGFRELLTKHRMTVAYELMEEGKLTALEISEKIGFKSYSGFYTAFKKSFGISPEKMRKEADKM